MLWTKGASITGYWDQMPQVLQEELILEVRIWRNIEVCLCSKVWEINLDLHPNNV